MKALTFILLAAIALGTFISFGGCSRLSDDDSMKGGVTRCFSYDAPKVIHSTEIIALNSKFFLRNLSGVGGQWWVFEVSREGDNFLLSMKGKIKKSTAVDATYLREVHAVIMKHKLPELNGFDKVTSGLPPAYAPCSLSIDYASGERLYFRMNNNPTANWSRELKELFLKVLEKEQK